MGKENTPFCCHQNFVPSGLSVPAWGYIHMVKHEKMYIKSDFKAFVLNLQQMGKEIRAFLLTSKVCPLVGLPALAFGLYTYIKSLKMCIKSYFSF